MQEIPAEVGPIGRAARILLGFILLGLAWGFITSFEAVVQAGNVVLYAWAIVGMFSHVLGTVVPPFRNERIRLPLIAFIALSTLIADKFIYGDWWGPPLGWMLYILALAGMGILGMEFILAG